MPWNISCPYYDYYQPEAYMSVSDTYIEKDLSINAEVDQAASAPPHPSLSGRQDVIIVASGILHLWHGESLTITSRALSDCTKGQVVSRTPSSEDPGRPAQSRWRTWTGDIPGDGDTVDINLPCGLEPSSGTDRTGSGDRRKEARAHRTCGHFSRPTSTRPS